ncbi:hypothetical protein [Nocardia sp. R6R-6]|uniref:hypothetical protein n=1 Tax=Nocardia sp. R6R-6 TaxID=3459303 RepID=UPI00403DDE24
MELDGWGDLRTELHPLSEAGAWSAMATLIDAVLNTFTIVGETSRIGAEIMRRFADIFDRFTLYTPYPLHESARRTIIDDLHAPAQTPTPSR